jgi:nucleotide-binding universal stress UspA family protein
MTAQTLAKLVIDFFESPRAPGPVYGSDLDDARRAREESLRRVAEYVLHGGSNTAGEEFGTILVAVNDSAPARRALDTAALLARRVEGRLVLLHVVDISKGFSPELGLLREAALDELRQRGHDLLQQLADALPSALRVETKLRHGDPATEILRMADECNAQLIALGTYGRNRMVRMLLGSTAEAVIRAARIPVLAASGLPAPVGKSLVNQQSSAGRTDSAESASTATGEAPTGRCEETLGV